MSEPACVPAGGEASAPTGSPFIGCAGQLETVAISPADGRVLVSGWVVCPPDVTPWLDQASGWRLPLVSAFRDVRQDLLNAEHPALNSTSACRAGFVFCAPAIAEGEALRLVVTRGSAGQVLSERLATVLPADPLQAFSVMAALPGETHWLPERHRQVDWPLLDGLLEQRQRSWAQLPVEVHAHGPQLSHPRLSVILVLGDRPDALLLQLLRLAQDDWLRQHAEVLCVLDAPAHAQTWHAQASTWARLSGVSLRSVWGWAGRGLAGACQLGAEQAHAPVLVWLPQDVVPLASGWARALWEVLDTQPGLGAVAPRLLRPDGAQAQAGLTYQADDAHPTLLRLRPIGHGAALPQGQGVAQVPALGAAGLMLRQADWQRIGGWPGGYVGPTHAAPDMCLGLRQVGLMSACHHGVALMTLGLPTAGLTPPRAQRLSLLDAQRHQWRWGEQLEELAHHTWPQGGAT